MRTSSTSTLTLESVEQRLNEALISLQHLAADVAKLRHAQSAPEPHNSQEALVAQLLAEGVIVKPSPEMLAIGAEWDAVPEEEKRALDETLRNLQLDPPVSEMIDRMRSGVRIARRVRSLLLRRITQITQIDADFNINTQITQIRTSMHMFFR